MKRLIFIEICLYIYLLFPVVSVAQSYQNDLPSGSMKINKVVFTGKVTDGRTGEALAGASVYIADLKTGAITNNQGLFLISNISPGRHLIEVSFVGYSTHTEYLEISGDIQKDFALSASIMENNEVVITGVSTATQIRRTPTPVTVVKRQDLIKISSTNLVDAISRNPGVAQISSGPAISKPVIRGLGYNRLIVMNDGVRQEGQQWGDEHGIEIDEYSVSKIEILKGPASLMYGSDAMAGVINILTNVPVAEGAFKGNIISNFQTNNRLRGVGVNLGAYHKQGFNWNAYGSFKASGDYTNKYDGRVYNSKFNEVNAGGYAGFNGSWGYSHLIFSSYNQQAGIIEGERDDYGNFTKQLPGGGTALPTTEDFNSVSPQIPRQMIKHVKVVSENNFNIGKGRLLLVVGNQNNKRMEFGNIDNPSQKDLFFDLHTITYSAIYNIRENKNWRSSFGLTGMIQSNKNKGAEALIPEYNLFDVGGFVYTQKTADKFTLSGGIRFDNRSLHSKLFMDGSVLKFDAFQKNFSNLSGSAGISFLVSKQFIIKLNIARGFRAPSIPELASNGTHEGTNRYEYGQKDLQSETSVQLDGGLEWNTQHLSVTASLFYNSIDHFIFYRKLAALGGGDSTVTVNGKSIAAFQFNQQNAMINGAEFTIDIHPHPLDWLHFENTISFVKGQFKEAIEGSNNIPFIPAARLLSDLRADLLPKGKLLHNAFVKLEVERMFAQNHPFTAYNTETVTSAYTLVNVGIGSDVISKKNKTLFSLYITALNVGDIAYQNHLSRLKYAPQNRFTGRSGVFNVGRNFSLKLNVPLSGRLYE